MRVQTVRNWEDAKAFVVLAVTVVTSAAYLLDCGDSAPKPLQGVGRNKLAQFRHESASTPELRKLVPAYMAR